MPRQPLFAPGSTRRPMRPSTWLTARFPPPRPSPQCSPAGPRRTTQDAPTVPGFATGATGAAAMGSTPRRPEDIAAALPRRSPRTHHYHCRVETDAAPCCTRSLRATVRGSFLPTKPASTGHRNPPVHQELKPALQPCNQNRVRRITDDDGTSRGMPMPLVRRTSDTGTGSPSRTDAAGTRRLFMTDEKRTHT
jgi:hypothetical protein